MESNIDHLVKPVQSKRTLSNPADSTKYKIKNFYCSTFIKERKILVKGEGGHTHRPKRKALIILFCLDTGTVKDTQGFKTEYVGTGLTSFDQQVYSLGHFEWNHQIYIAASGRGRVDLFRLRDFRPGRLTGRLSCKRVCVD